MCKSGSFITKSKRKRNFTTVSNDYLRDENLSWKAKGLITYIMSLPPDWDLNISDLKKRSKDGRDSTSTGIQELIENGYCTRVLKRDEKGRVLGYDYTVSDIKEFENSDCPITDAPITDNPTSDNQSLLNTNSNKDLYILNTKETISKDIAKKKISLEQQEQELINELYKFKDDYTKGMLNDFYLYWTEPNKSKTKCKYTMQKTWDTSRRLKTWERNNFNKTNFKNNNLSNNANNNRISFNGVKTPGSVNSFEEAARILDECCR